MTFQKRTPGTKSGRRDWVRNFSELSMRPQPEFNEIQICFTWSTVIIEGFTCDDFLTLFITALKIELLS